jgi:hypothetical protein
MANPLNPPVVVTANPGYELLAAYRMTSTDGRFWWQISSSPIVAWRITTKGRPQPIPVSKPYPDALSVAIKQPDNGVTELGGLVYEDRGAWLRTLSCRAKAAA